MNILNKHYCHITKPTHTLAVKLGTETTATCGAETAYHPRAPVYTDGFWGVRVARSLVFCVMF
jgi:hypothetical protein